jgi:N-acetylneuraminic acid mutarotase
MEVFNPSSKLWEAPLPMQHTLIYHSASAIGDSIYTIGGAIVDSGAGGIELFDAAQGSWTFRNKLLTPRISHQSVVLNGEIYILGGQDKDVDTTLSSVEIYNPANNTVRPGVAMSIPRSSFGAVVLNNKIYVIGGFNTRSSSAISSVSVFDPATQQWTEKRPLPTGRHEFAVCTDGTFIYVIGGTEQNAYDAGQANTVWRYYP